MGQKVLNSKFKDKFEEKELNKGVLVPEPHLKPHEFLESCREILNVDNSFKLRFNEENVHLSNPFWEESVKGRIIDWLVPYILRARKEVKDEEEFGYKWKKQQEILTASEVEQEDEKTVVAWDIKITSDDEAKILEFHESWFGVEGFETAFQYGPIDQEMKKFEGCRGSFSEFLIKHAINKNKTHRLIGDLMPRLIEGEIAEDEKVVLKPGYGESGMGVKILEAEDYRNLDEKEVTTRVTPFQDELMEEFVAGKDIEFNGERYEGCMRYVTGIEIKNNRLVLTDLGGYWRLASKTKSSEASSYEKYVANLASGIKSPADFKDLSIAFRVASKATRKLYKSWLYKSKG